MPAGRAEQIAALAALALLALGTFAVLRPFVAAILWAFVIALATWPAFDRLLAAVGGRRTLAAALMVLVLTACLIVPLGLAGFGLSRSVPNVITWAREIIADPPPPPTWLMETPILDDTIGLAWQQIAHREFNLAGTVEPHVGRISSFLLGVAAAIGGGLFQLGISLLIAFFLYRDGDFVAGEVRSLMERVAGARAKRLLREAHGTMTGVIYGIIGTALLQGFLTALGLWLAGVPTPLLLGALAAVVSPLPWGVGLVIWPSALWLAFEGNYFAAAFVFIWGIAPVGVVDNVVRPLFVSRSSRLPFVLVLMGLIGGALVAGVVGLFLGPVILAVAYALLREWAAEHREREVRAAE